MNNQRIFVFDLDHTLVRANLSFGFGKFLFKKGYMPFSNMLKTLIAYALHKGAGFPLEWLHDQVLRHFLSRLPKSRIAHLAQEYLDRDLESLYHPKVLEELIQAKKEGFKLALCSSSPDFIVGEVAARMQISYWCASCYLTDEKGYLSEIDPVVDGRFKAEYLKKLMMKYDLPKEAVTVYSDSVLDLPLFEVSGQRVAVNPDRKLRKFMNQSNWREISQ